MIKRNVKIEGIPALLWGDPSDRLFVAIHGNMSSKDDASIVIFAEEAVGKGYQVLSFDLPEHGDRKTEDYACNVQNCVSDLNTIMDYAKTISNSISIFACSMGAYFSLVAYKDLELQQCLFLSPILDMERIINNMMVWFDVSENKLKIEKEIKTDGGILNWDYYSYVKAHPIEAWNKPTAILYGSNDNVTEFDVISVFTKRNHCKLQVLEKGEHYFHTDGQLNFYRQWLRDNILLLLGF